MNRLDYITTNHIGGKHLIVQMSDFAAVATFERGDDLPTVVRKLRRLAADIEILSRSETLPQDSPHTQRSVPRSGVA